MPYTLNQLSDLVTALKAITAEVQSWHDFHRGNTIVKCDSLCALLPSLRKAKTPEEILAALEAVTAEAQKYHDAHDASHCDSICTLLPQLQAAIGEKGLAQ